MSTSERLNAMAQTWTHSEVAASSEVEQRVPTPIVPGGSIAGRSLTAVVAIMTFLAALATGAVMMVMSAANDWQSDVAREVTIQVRPISGRDLEADVRSAVALARATAGIADVRAYTKEESAQLVEPWLGTGLQLSDLPIPRMVVVKLASGAAPNFPDLRKQLADQVPSASLDDHRGWIARMRIMADTAVIVGLIMLVLVMVVTVLSVTFATRGAMATNRPTIEVLHYIGATDNFVASQFQRHFLILGLKGGAIGGGVAMALFGFLQTLDTWLAGTAGGDEMTALFGSLSIGAAGYVAILVLIVAMALVTACASRRTVGQTLQTVD